MSTQEKVAANGTAPPVVDPLEGVIAQLEEQLAPIAAERSQLEAQVADLMRREQRIKAGISALRTGSPSKPKVDKQAWTPSQATLDDIYAVIARTKEPMTITNLVEATTHSRGTIEKGVAELRRREKLRLVGNAGTGGARLFAVMPS